MQNKPGLFHALDEWEKKNSEVLTGEKAGKLLTSLGRECREKARLWEGASRENLRAVVRETQAPLVETILKGNEDGEDFLVAPDC